MIQIFLINLAKVRIMVQPKNANSLTWIIHWAKSFCPTNSISRVQQWLSISCVIHLLKSLDMSPPPVYMWRCPWTRHWSYVAAPWSMYSCPTTIFPLHLTGILICCTLRSDMLQQQQLIWCRWGNKAHTWNTYITRKHHLYSEVWRSEHCVFLPLSCMLQLSYSQLCFISIMTSKHIECISFSISICFLYFLSKWAPLSDHAAGLGLPLRCSSVGSVLPSQNCLSSCEL